MGRAKARAHGLEIEGGWSYRPVVVRDGERPLDFDSFTLISLSNAESGFELELTVNKSQSEAYDLGNGYGHLAVSVAGLDAAHARMAGEGQAPGDIKELAHSSGGKARFFFITDPDGYKIEVLQRGWRFL